MAALQIGDFSRIDMDELINEVGSIASGLRRELMSLLKDIIEALLLHSAPTLQDAITQVIDKAYQRAKDNVIEDYSTSLPNTCPFQLDRIVEDPYDRLMAEGKLA